MNDGLEACARSPSPSGFAGGEHAILIYDSKAEYLETLVPFLKDGLERGERCVHVCDDLSPGEVQGALRSGGVDVGRSLARGSLRFLEKWDYRQPGRLNPERMSEVVGGLLEDALRDGFRGLRVAIDMTWTIDPAVDSRDLGEWECLWNVYFTGRPLTAICAYNRGRLDPSALRFALETHPVRVSGGEVAESPHYREPDAFFADGDELSLERMFSLTEALWSRLDGSSGSGSLAAITAGRLSPGDHVCLVYESTEEYLDGIAPFVRDGLASRDRTVVVAADAPSPDEVVAGLAARGIDAARARTEGSLTFLSKWEYRQKDELDADAMGTVLQTLLDETLAAGHTGIRLLVDMSWTIAPHVCRDRLTRWEASGNEVVQGVPITAVCAYGLDRLDPRVIRSAMTTHPTVVVRGGAYRNPFYRNGVPGEERDGNGNKNPGVSRLRRLFRELKEAEEDKERFARLVEHSRDFIALLDRDGRLSYLNAAAREAFGIDAKEDARGLFFQDYWKGTCWEEIAGRCLSGGSGDVRTRGRLRAPGAAGPVEGIDVECSFFRISGPQGSRQVAAVLRDMRERNRYEKELRRRVAQLREADQRKDEYLATLAHELRNPLAPMTHALAVLARVRDDPERLDRVLSVLEDQTGHLTRLVDDLLDVSRITRGKIELRKRREDLNDILGSVLDALRPDAESSGIRLASSLAGGKLFIECDPVRISQVVTNLLANALKFTPAGGTIDVASGRDGAEAFVRVRDSGIGLSPEMVERIFEVFVQEKRARNGGMPGLGIGLTVAKSLVELHGGRIRAASEGRGRGSEFTIQLPLDEDADATPAEPTSRKRRSPPGPGASYRVLIVEDTKDVADMLACLLDMMGHETRTVYDPTRTLAEAEAFTPDVFLCDISMPGMNGFEVAAAVRSRDEFKDALLVAMTGYGQAEDRHRSHQAGFDFHLTKPASPEDIEEVFREIERRRG